jgi:hypothetical protein
MTWWWIVPVLPAFYLGRGRVADTVVFYVLFMAVCYGISLVLHPHRVCRHCKGTGRQRGAMFKWGDRPCTVCGGGPRHRRWGVQIFSREDPVWAERAAAVARKRSARPR